MVCAVKLNSVEFTGPLRKGENTTTTVNIAQPCATKRVHRFGRAGISTRRKDEYSASATSQCSTNAPRRTLPRTGNSTSTMSGATMRVSMAKMPMRWTAIVRATSVAAALLDGTNPNAQSTAHSVRPNERLPKNVNGYGLALPYDMTLMTASV